jgi:hypothetical protein
MSDVPTPRSTARYEPGRAAPSGYEPTNLADVLDRILDKGLVIAGDISISLAQVELITIKIRLLIASADKAKEMGIDWWTRDPSLSGGAGPTALSSGGDADQAGPAELAEENRQLRTRLVELERRLTSRAGSVESMASKSVDPVGVPQLIEQLRAPRTEPPAPRTSAAGGTDDASDDEDDHRPGDRGAGSPDAGDRGAGSRDAGGRGADDGGAHDRSGDGGADDEQQGG